MTPSTGKAAARATKAAGGGRYDARREDIVRIAVDLFAKNGYETTSIGDLAAAAGLLKGSLYYYVPSKEQLLMEILSAVQREGSEILEKIEDLKRQGAGLDEQIRTFVELGCRYTLTHPAEIAVYFRSFTSLNARSQQKLLKERQTYERALLQLVKEGQASGVFDATVPPSVIMTAVHALVNWLALSPVPTHVEDRVTTNDIAKSYADLLLHGVVRTPVT
jgi:AcrR family transcriptional regulator